MLPSSIHRVSTHSSAATKRINQTTAKSLKNLSQGSDREISERLQNIEEEWDIERAIEANAASLIIIGAALAGTVNRKWLALPAVVGSFLLQHANQGWCPPVPILRRLGFRTAHEIAAERFALKRRLGDFDRSNEMSETFRRALP